MALAQVSNQLLRSDGNSATTVAASWPITGNGSQELPLGLDPSYSGADGISPIFDISAIPSGHRVTISGAQGASSFDVMNGEKGDHGVQGETGPQGPEGPQGPSGQQGPAGQNGVNGISPTFRFDRSGDYVVVTMSGAQGEESFTIYDGTSATEYSAGANIDITDYIISGKDWTEEITSATSGKLDTTVFESYTAAHSGDDTAAYSAGDNIDITDHVISGKDWSDEINNATTAGSAAATAWVSDQHYLTEHQSLSALMSADLLGITGGVITGYSGMPVSAGMTYSGIAPIVVNNEEEKISADCIELSAGSGIDSNKLALGIIEVSATIPTGAGGLTVCAWSDVTANPAAFYNNITANPSEYAITDGGKLATLAGIEGSPSLSFTAWTTYKFAVDNCNSATDVYSVKQTRVPFPPSTSYAASYNTVQSPDSVVCAYSALQAIRPTDVPEAARHFEQYIIALTDTNYEQPDQNYSNWTTYCKLANKEVRYDGIGTTYVTYTGVNSAHNKFYTVSASYHTSDVSLNLASAVTDLDNSSVPTYYASTANIKFSAVANTLAASGIVFPYDAWANARQVYNFYGSAAADNVSSFTFKKYQSNGYETTLLVYDNNGTTGVSAESLKVWATPQEAECKVVLVSTSGNIPPSGSTDGKLYVVTGT